MQGFHWLERSYMCVYTHTGIRERKEEGGGMEEVEDKMVGEAWGHTWRSLKWSKGILDVETVEKH